jgi:uncharacterized protein
MRSWIALATLFFTGWLTGGAALAQPAQTSRSVADDLGLFSAEAKAKANAVIGRIRQQHKKDLVIETTQGPKKPAGLDEKNKAAFFDDWAAARFKNQQINGVYVVILDKPKMIRVVVGSKTLESGMFTKANRDELFHKVQEKLKTSDEDGALLAAVNYVADTLQANARTSSGATPQTAPPAKKTGGEGTDDGAQPQVQASPIIKWLLIGLAVVLVFWLVSAVIRALGSMGGAGGYGGSGGGGFFSSLLGGLFGAAAGMWMYDHFFGGGTPSATAGPSGGYTPSEPTDVGAGEPSVGGGDYEANQGAVEEPADAGDWSSGGDWGGGGGDFGGGGDWGGGGGDW